MNNLAPIVLFVYNRPDHTKKTLEALSSNKLADESTLYIFADGPKPGAKYYELERINEVRNLIKSKKWAKEIIIRHSQTNKGLAESIVNGVTEVVNKHEKVIVLEDDIVTSEGFLTYMNAALEKYEKNKKVMHVSGFQYPIDILGDQETYFVNIYSCWGWGTWKYAWNYYDNKIDNHFKWLGKKAKRINKFNIEGNGHFYEQLLLNKDGKIKTWAVKWYASWFRKQGYALYPKQTLTLNIGHDGSGEHCAPNTMYESVLAKSICVEDIPLRENKEIRQKVNKFYKENFNINPRLERTLYMKIKVSLHYKLNALVGFLKN